ncbi:tRNA modification GTPase MnmE [Posidoniimonas corsicana]|uniref:tRNA modification GTPase MnmE n=1 Tax=Posidoniimonas corsicana TaxID=1938618 RepID=A0A5C5UYS8_9BACT|nr:GTP-binding protein [Posidoniimonas corsicana]TWT31009.1 tRNA modification GTPase MnmE [Posidoniimonas corsicana]
MGIRKPSAGLLLVLLLIGGGYAVVSVTPNVVEQFKGASDINPAVGYAYLAVVSLGALAFLIGVGYLFFRLAQNARAKHRDLSRRSTDPSKLTAKQREAELADNLAAGREFAATAAMKEKLREELERLTEELEAKRKHRRLEIVAFGTISSGKSSLLNALCGQDAFRSSVVGGTTVAKSSVPWPGEDKVVLVDTPGLAEADDESHGAVAIEAAEQADLVLFVVDGPLKHYEQELLELLAKMEKRVVLCLNKEDWYDSRQQPELLAQLAEQASPAVAPEDIVAVRASAATRRQVRVLPDGTEEVGEVTDPPDISPLADRLLKIVRREGGDLLLANLLTRSRGLVDDAKEKVLVALDEEADRVINRYMWAAGGAGLIPIPLLDLAGGSAVTIKMIIDLAEVYKQKIDTDTVVEMLAQLSKNLIASLGASAAATGLSAALGSVLKTVPGVGTITGGLLQGTVQALVTRWIGKVFCEYYRNEMKTPPGGLAEMAKRQWKAVTAPDELRKLVRLGREHIEDPDD